MHSNCSWKRDPGVEMVVRQGALRSKGAKTVSAACTRAQAEKLGGAPPAIAKPAEAKPGEQGKEEPDQAPGRPRGGAWWQWLLVIVAMPVLAVISLVGAIVWLLLLPLKCCCCPLGCAAQLVWSAVEWLLKAPFRALLWASGKPWKPQRPPELREGGHAEKAKGKAPPV